jgi:hypothetical protein
MVKFRQLNLLADFSSLGAFDLIFCRNVLIYFDQDTKTNVLNRLGRLAAADGYLVLGAAETVVGSDRQLPHPAGIARRLCPERAPAAAPDRRRGQGSSAPGCRQRRALIRLASISDSLRRRGRTCSGHPRLSS